jgi:VanZ family protein
MLFRYAWPPLLWSIIVLTLSVIPGKSLPDVGIFQIDKLVHFFFFGVLMLLCCYSVYKISPEKYFFISPLLMAGIYSVAFGVMIEILQKFVPGRSFSLADMLANSIGVGIGYLTYLVVRKNFLNS